MSQRPYKSPPFLIEHYKRYQQNGNQPFLLESLGPISHICRKSILGINPTISLEVWQGTLYRNSEQTGSALDIFDHLPTLSEQKRGSTSIFPLWIGFFSYEFAQHFGLATHKAMPGMPEAAWYYYPTGYSCDVCADVLPQLENQGIPPAILKEDRYAISSSISKPQYLRAIETIQNQIKNGEVYQVNLSKQVSISNAPLDPLQLYRRLRANNPSPFMGLVEREGWAICSGSPERLFSHNPDSWISARPIAGTRKRGKTDVEDAYFESELRQSPKENAEHVMLADLLRNDVSRCCAPGSVQMTEALSVEKYAHVMHLVSEVTGKSNSNLKNMFRAIFPGGTITGAPKPAVMATIHQLEPLPRGPYTGSMGYISSNGSADFNILIRSPFFIENKLHFSTGGGVVIDSNGEKEWDETEHKAGSFYDSLSGRASGRAPEAPKFFQEWRPTKPRKASPSSQPNKKVLFLENNDSFSYNIVNYFEMLGAQVEMINSCLQGNNPNDEILHQMRDDKITHIVIGPGPGCPDDYPHFRTVIRMALEQEIPLLGTCLGHQAIGQYFGATVKHARSPIHGEAHPMHFFEEDLFDGIASGSEFTRYHSLILDNLPKTLIPLAHSSCGEIMAMRHRDKAIYGVQFHPESFMSNNGLTILDNFLHIKHTRLGTSSSTDMVCATL